MESHSLHTPLTSIFTPNHGQAPAAAIHDGFAQGLHKQGVTRQTELIEGMRKAKRDREPFVHQNEKTARGLESKEEGGKGETEGGRRGCGERGRGKRANLQP